jgi:cadmium resistance protein CadD (predicted permease)
MVYTLAWISLVLVSLSLIFINRWVKEEAQLYALIGLIVIEASLWFSFFTLKY